MLGNMKQIAFSSALVVSTLIAGETTTLQMGDLMWEDDANTKSSKYTHSQAKTYCENLTLGAYSDWRLPTVRELFEIVDFNRYRPAIDQKFENCKRNGAYWSSTKKFATKYDEGKTEYWEVDFYKGRVTTKDEHEELYVRCVRSTNATDATPSAPKTTKAQTADASPFEIESNFVTTTVLFGNLNKKREHYKCRYDGKMLTCINYHTRSNTVSELDPNEIVSLIIMKRPKGSVTKVGNLTMKYLSDSFTLVIKTKKDAIRVATRHDKAESMGGNSIRKSAMVMVSFQNYDELLHLKEKLLAINPKIEVGFD